MSEKVKTWSVQALIPFPMLPDEGSLLSGADLKVLSRAPRDVRLIDNKVIRFLPVNPPDGWVQIAHGSLLEPIEIQIKVLAEDAHLALNRVDNLLESIIDDLSFRLQFPLPIRMLQVIDVSEPVAIGMEREFLLFTYPTGYQHSKFGNTIFSGLHLTEKVPELRHSYSDVTERQKSVLRWYHKALASTSQVDTFIFLFVCLEILASKTKNEIKEPYITSCCQHHICNCPNCGKSIQKPVSGTKLKNFLVNNLGIEPEMAKRIWGLRQMVHGDNDLSGTNVKMEQIPNAMGALKGAVARGIKQFLNWSEDNGPISLNDHIEISSQIWMAGSRAVTEFDL